MNNQWPIFPLVRQVVRQLALVAAYAAIASAGLSLLGVVLLEAMSLLPVAVGSLFIADSLLYLHLALLPFIMLWCHEVLPAGRGFTLTRYLLFLAAFNGVLLLVCESYLAVTGGLLLARQAEIPAFIWVVVLCSFLFNLGNLSAAPAKWKWLYGLYLFLLLPALLIAGTPLLLPGAVCKILVAAAGSPLLQALARLAPRIVSLPEKK